MTSTRALELLAALGSGCVVAAGAALPVFAATDDHKAIFVAAAGAFVAYLANHYGIKPAVNAARGV